MTALALPDPPLRDEVVALRPWREDDVPERLMRFADPTVLRFAWPQTGGYSEADARSFFAQQERARDRGDELALALAEPADDTAGIGGASLYDVDLGERRAAVGYWLVPAARGRGAATHAVGLLTRWAFDELGLARVELTCDP